MCFQRLKSPQKGSSSSSTSTALLLLRLGSSRPPENPTPADTDEPDDCTESDHFCIPLHFRWWKRGSQITWVSESECSGGSSMLTISVSLSEERLLMELQTFLLKPESQFSF